MKSSVHSTDEPRLTHRLRHDNMLTCLAWFVRPGSLLLTLPYMPGGTLTEHVNNEGTFSCNDGVRVAIGIGSGLNYLHNSLIIHRELKTDNVLLTSAIRTCAVPKISDFGYARTCAHGHRCYTVCGTPWYMAPEVWALTLRSPVPLQGYSFPVDVWSFGVVMYAMFTGCLPFDKETPSVRAQVLENRVSYDDLDWDHIPCIRTLVHDMLTTSTIARLSAAHVLRKLMQEAP